MVTNLCQAFKLRKQALNISFTYTNFLPLVYGLEPGQSLKCACLSHCLYSFLSLWCVSVSSESGSPSLSGNCSYPQSELWPLVPDQSSVVFSQTDTSLALDNTLAVETITFGVIEFTHNLQGSIVCKLTPLTPQNKTKKEKEKDKKNNHQM